MRNKSVVCALGLLAAQAFPAFGDSLGYEQMNLVSDVSTVGAKFVDADLKNPWGMSFSAGSPFWISNAASNTSTLYNGAGTKGALTVSVAGAPTGQVFNSAGSGNFLVNGSASTFIFDTLSGTITGWNNVPAGNMIAANPPPVSTPGAVYTGLAITPAGTSTPRLYAANFTSGGGINVFDSSFNQLNATTFAGKFATPAGVPSDYAPFNIQLIGSDLYVEYAQVSGTPGNATRGAGKGYVAEFDLSGNRIQEFTDTHLNAPWGVAIAPNGFGQFSQDVLVGNFGDGTINAFDPNSGTYIGTLDDQNGNPIVNANLWALDFRTPGAAGSVGDALYFDAGINRQQDGLFGYIQPVPEPSVYGMAALGVSLTAALLLRRRRKALE
jgi:uncharacterized protein (TIGR03118 family)